MKKMHFRLALLLSTIFVFSSCTVKEKIVFNEDLSGEYIVEMDMANFMKEMKTMGGGSISSDKPGKVMDTTVNFNDLMTEFKDSLATLPEERQLAIESLKDMYMTMQMDEDKGIFLIGTGFIFNDIDDLKGIRDRINKARSLNDKDGQVESITQNSPLEKFMGDQESDVLYNFTDNSFSRTTLIDDETIKELKELFKEVDSDDEEEMKGYFKESAYIVEITFPKKIKSTSIKDAQISKDGKTISYKADWMNYITNPKLLDIDVEFIDE